MDILKIYGILQKGLEKSFRYEGGLTYPDLSHLYWQSRRSAKTECNGICCIGYLGQENLALLLSEKLYRSSLTRVSNLRRYFSILECRVGLESPRSFAARERFPPVNRRVSPIRMLAK